MPRRSKRITYLKKLEDRVVKLRKAYLCSLRSDSELFETDNHLYLLYMVSYRKLKILSSKRYLFRKKKYRRNKGVCMYDADFDDAGDTPWLNDDEFLAAYRMSRKSMNKLIELTKHHHLFERHTDGAFDEAKTEKACRVHMMHLLHFLGSFGEAGNNTNSRNRFKQGYGTYENMRNRCIRVIFDTMKEEYLNWPDSQEREELAQQIQSKYGWPNCIGYLDGTLFPLYFKPQTSDCGDYFGRKLGYTISAIIASDENLFIRYINAGWPGCAHDDRILRNSNLWKNCGEYFNFKEYLLLDSAFTPADNFIPAFGTGHGMGVVYAKMIYVMVL